MRRVLPHMLVALAVTGVTFTAVVTDASTARTAPGIDGRPRPLGSVCRYSHSGPDDPIVHPGMAGMAHSHDFFGNTSTVAASTPTTLRAAGTTCRIGADTAAYWMPSLYADGVQVVPSRVHAYYGAKVTTPVVAPPADLRIIAGGTRDTVVFTCMRAAMPTAMSMRVRPCTGNGAFTIGIKFPDCWNGVDLDSADHRSHMAYSSKGACPQSHPVAVARLFLFAVYPGVPETASLTLASGGLETAHADFFNTWDQDALAKAIDHCLNERRNCQKQTPKELGLRPPSRRADPAA